MSGSELKAIREELGLDVTTFAAYLGVSFWTVAQWEQGRRNVGMDPFSLEAALNAADLARAEGNPLPDWRNLGWPGKPVTRPATKATRKRKEVQA